MQLSIGSSGFDEIKEEAENRKLQGVQENTRYESSE